MRLQNLADTHTVDDQAFCYCYQTLRGRLQIKYIDNINKCLYLFDNIIITTIIK